nr:cytochrome c family protein [uncultured Cohaesibacter sp.]
MNFFEFNKMAGAVLMALIFIMVTGMATGYIFSDDAPDQPGYAIEVADGSGGGAAKEPEPEVDFATLLASADAGKGERVAKKCAACHTFDAEMANKTGPHLFGVVNRAVASVDDFKYSDAMTAFGEGKVWDPEHLNTYLTKPKDMVPGTAMAFAGLKKPEDRANLISYLQTLKE